MADTPTPVDPVKPKSFEDRLALLEWAFGALIEELKRHVSLRLPDPPGEEPAADAAKPTE